MKKFMKKIIILINIVLLVLIMYFAKDVFSYYFFNQNMVTVPNVTNLNKDEAAKILKQSKLDYNFINSRSNEVAFDIVYKQMPRANEKVKINRAVKLYVNNNEGDKIPDLRSLVVEDAVNILKEKNIEIERIDYIRSDVSEDTVIASYPKEGSSIRYKEKITLLVATRKLELENRVPNVIGMDILDAENTLKKAGYENIDIIGVNSSNFPINSVVKINPTPNTELSKDSLIKVYISMSDEDSKIVEDKENMDKLIEDIIRKSIDDSKK